MKNMNIETKKALILGCIAVTCVTLMACKSSNQKTETHKEGVVSSLMVADNKNDKQNVPINSIQNNTQKQEENKIKPAKQSNTSTKSFPSNKVDKIKESSNKSKYTRTNKKSSIKNSIIKNNVKNIEKKSTHRAEANYKLTYSNLVDATTQSKIVKMLKNSKINDKDVDAFIKCVQDYNNTVGALKTSKNGFTGINTYQVNYDEGHIFNKFYSKSDNPTDINCRLTAFRLFKNNIVSDSNYKGDSTDLMFDLDGIERYPLYKITDNEVEKFVNLYAAIPTEPTQDVQKHADIIKKEWAKRKIKFLQNSRVSLINAFLHYPETKNVFSGHSGVLVKDKDGLFFIEKYALYMPYQVSKFKTKSELKKYLLDRLDVKGEPGASKPIIMENDTFMK